MSNKSCWSEPIYKIAEKRPTYHVNYNKSKNVYKLY